MPVKQNEQAAGNGGGDAVSAKYLNIPLSEIVIDAQIRSEIDIEDESFQSLKASIVKISLKSANSVMNRLTLLRLPGEVQESPRAGNSYPILRLT